jgi:hypothetical protein
MKIIALFLLSMLITSSVHSQNNPVVIELFTSQGCSSCPDADKNLTQILQQAKKEGKQVYGLSFHVDYWNYIGWKDPYSSKEFTARQRKYGEEMNLRSIYTPQMIVNGKEEFVGSDRTESSKAVATALNQKSLYTIAISRLTVSGEVLSFTYSLDKAPSDEIINVAVVEKNIENYVPRGENSGKKLHHDNVVRTFITQPVKKEQPVQLSLSKMNINNALVIVYIQNKDRVVVGAASSSLN